MLDEVIDESPHLRRQVKAARIDNRDLDLGQAVIAEQFDKLEDVMDVWAEVGDVRRESSCAERARSKFAAASSSTWRFVSS